MAEWGLFAGCPHGPRTRLPAAGAAGLWGAGGGGLDVFRIEKAHNIRANRLSRGRCVTGYGKTNPQQQRRTGRDNSHARAGVGTIKILNPGRLFAGVCSLLAAAAGLYLYRAQTADDLASQVCPLGEVGNCYIKLDSPADCYYWSGGGGKNAGARIIWRGACENRLAQGMGTLDWQWQDQSGHAAGMIEEGQLQGQWVEQPADGVVQEGPYRDSKKHGQWFVQLADGTVAEGPFRDGKEHGRWVLRLADGSVQEGSYRNGREHGHWVLRLADGSVQEGPYRDGKKHGRWVLRLADGETRELLFRNGIRE